MYNALLNDNVCNTDVIKLKRDKKLSAINVQFYERQKRKDIYIKKNLRV